jgi:hypothetical protein
METQGLDSALLWFIILSARLTGGCAMSDGHWQLEGTAAELFERYLVPAITAKWAEDLVDRAQPRKGDAILDIACAPPLWRVWQQNEWVEGWSPAST